MPKKESDEADLDESPWKGFAESTNNKEFLEAAAEHKYRGRLEEKDSETKTSKHKPLYPLFQITTVTAKKHCTSPQVPEEREVQGAERSEDQMAAGINKTGLMELLSQT